MAKLIGIKFVEKIYTIHITEDGAIGLRYGSHQFDRTSLFGSHFTDRWFPERHLPEAVLPIVVLSKRINSNKKKNKT